MNYNIQFFASWPVTMYLLVFLDLFAHVYYTKYQFEDEKAGWALSRSKWHPYGAIDRMLLFVALLLNPAVQDIFLAGTLYLLGFDIWVNKAALNMPLFYRGSTAKLDKGFGRYKFGAYFFLIAVALAVKIFTHPVFVKMAMQYH